MNLEKAKVVQSMIKKLEIENKELSDPKEMNNEINRFFKEVFAKTLLKSLLQVNNFFENILLLVLTQKQGCEKEISE